MIATPGSVDVDRARTIGLQNELNGDFLADETEAAALLTLGLLAPKLRFNCEANEGGGAASTESPECNGDRMASISGEDAADDDLGTTCETDADDVVESETIPDGRGDE